MRRHWVGGIRKILGGGGCGADSGKGQDGELGKNAMEWECRGEVKVKMSE